MRKPLPMALVCAMALPACEVIPGIFAPTARDHEAWFITTELDVYEAEIGEIVVQQDTIWYLEFSIEMTYTNRSDIPIYLLAHPGEPVWPVPPRIERLTDDGEWKTVYEAATVLRMEPRKIGPGEGFLHQQRFRAYDPQGNVSPAWHANTVEGVHRLNFHGSYVRTGPGPESEAAPLEARVSNHFRIAGTLP